MNNHRSAAASLTMLVLLASVACTSGTSHNEASPEASPEEDSGFGQYVDVGGYSLWIWCEGTGSPTVLLESGLGGSGTDGSWSEVQPDLSTEGQVCRYDVQGLELAIHDRTTASLLAQERWPRSFARFCEAPA